MSIIESIRKTQLTGRRRFLTYLSGAAATLAASFKALQSQNVPPRKRVGSVTVLPDAANNTLIRMQKELDAALQNSRTPNWNMVVDARKCIGCNACTVACRAQFPAGPSGSFRRIIEVTAPSYYGPVAIFKPVNCLQCDDPPCAKAVPHGAIWNRPDGIVVIDYQRVTGEYARAASQACPFKAIYVDDGRTFTQDTPGPQRYEERRFMENGQVWYRAPEDNPLADTARKCNFCEHLLEVGTLPACVSTCIGGAMYFGDANDPRGLIHELLTSRSIFRNHDPVGPHVRYLEDSMPGSNSLDCLVCHD